MIIPISGLNLLRISKEEFNPNFRLLTIRKWDIKLVCLEAKKTVEGIGKNGSFYPTALKLFFNHLVVCHLKMKELTEKPPINGNEVFFK